MIHKLEALHLEALCEEVRRCRILLSGCCHAVLVAVWRSHWSVCLQDLQQRVQKHSEVETVDLVLKLKDKLVSTNSEMVYCNSLLLTSPPPAAFVSAGSLLDCLEGISCSNVGQKLHACTNLKGKHECLLLLQSQAEKEHLPVRPGTLAKLQEHIEAVILSLPEDLQGILHKPSTP